MDSTQEDKKREEFRSILFDLADMDFSLKDASARSKIYQRLERLYYSSTANTRFRHFYSDIFIVLTAIQQNDRPGSIDVLGQNLGEIRCGYQVKNSDYYGNQIDIRDELKKLYDHVSLDIARINYSDAADRRVEQTESIVQIKNQVKQLQTQIDRASEDLVAQRHAVQDAQKEYITILGIFASIVLAFTAGIAFSTSVLENMHQVSVYRAVLIVLLIGLVLINILYGLFYYIDKLTKYRENETTSIKPLALTNILLLVLIIATCIAWHCGIVEKRNENIVQHDKTTVSEVESYNISSTDSAP